MSPTLYSGSALQGSGRLSKSGKARWSWQVIVGAGAGGATVADGTLLVQGPLGGAVAVAPGAKVGEGSSGPGAAGGAVAVAQVLRLGRLGRREPSA